MRDESSSHGANDRYMAHRSHSNLANMVDLNANNADFSSNSTPVELKKRKKHITIHTSQLNSHKFVSKLKIKVINHVFLFIFEFINFIYLFFFVEEF